MYFQILKKKRTIDESPTKVSRPRRSVVCKDSSILSQSVPEEFSLVSVWKDLSKRSVRLSLVSVFGVCVCDESDGKLTLRRTGSHVTLRPFQQFKSRRR